MTVQEYISKGKPESFKGDGSAYFRCPQCRGHKKLEVSARRTKWFCHKCGKGGCLRVNRISDSPILAQRPPLLREAGPDSLQWNYLTRGRGLSERLVRDLNPHQGGDNPFLVYFPFYSWGSEQPCYFIARSVLDGPGHPYWNPPVGMYSQRKSMVLWGLHRIKQPIPSVIVCEGVLDAIWFPTGVAGLGKTLSEAQIDLLSKVTTDEIIVMLDGDVDRSAHYLADKIAHRLTRHVSIVELPVSTDPNDMVRRGLDIWKFMERRQRVI